LGVMRKIAAQGIAIIFITHRLNEVMQAADGVTILRDGKLVVSKSVKETSLLEMAALMIGRGDDEQIHIAHRERQLKGSVALRVKNLSVDMPGERVQGVDLEVFEGEILGIGGLAGQGKVGLSNGIMGLYPAAGEVELFEEPLALNDAKGALKRGLAMVSEDRRGVGLLLDQGIEENIVFSAMQVHGDFLTGPKGCASRTARRSESLPSR